MGTDLISTYKIEFAGIREYLLLNGKATVFHQCTQLV